METYIKLKGSTPPNEDYYYIVAENGAFLHKTNLMMSATIRIPDLLEREMERVDLKYPKFSYQDSLKMIYFFSENYRILKSESIVLIYYHPTKGYLFSPPKQKVYKAMLRYFPDEKFDEYFLVGSIHCHGKYPAFHSEGQGLLLADKEDELDFDGLHIVIGNINSNTMTIVCSVVVNGRRFELNPLDYLSGILEQKIPLPYLPPQQYCREMRYKGKTVDYKPRYATLDAHEKLSPVFGINPYWAIDSGKKNWELFLQKEEERKALILYKLKERDQKTDSKVTSVYEHNDIIKKSPKYIRLISNPDIPYCFILDLPDHNTLEDFACYQYWFKKVKLFTVMERIKLRLTITH